MRHDTALEQVMAAQGRLPIRGVMGEIEEVPKPPDLSAKSSMRSIASSGVSDNPHSERCKAVLPPVVQRRFRGFGPFDLAEGLVILQHLGKTVDAIDDFGFGDETPVPSRMRLVRSAAAAMNTSGEPIVSQPPEWCSPTHTSS